MRSILVIRLSSLGDVILATPIVRQLAHSFPGVRIDVATATRFADVWKHNPYVAHRWEVDEDPNRVDALKLDMAATLPNGTYDLVVDLQHSLRSSVLRKGLCESLRVAPKYRREKLAMVWLKRFPQHGVHVVDRYRSCLEGLPLAFDVDGPEVWTAAEHAVGTYGDVPPIAMRQQRIAVAVGAHHGTKRWLPERFAALCHRIVADLGAVPVLVGGAADRDIVDAVVANAPRTTVRADGATSIDETIQVLDTCRAIVTNDTGVMHLAAARRLPVVALFGSTVPQLGFTPYGVPHRIVEANVRCRPCSHIGKRTCPKGHFRCMTDITVSQVFEQLVDLQV
jgi:heptosyltransferase-2